MQPQRFDSNTPKIQLRWPLALLLALALLALCPALLSIGHAAGEREEPAPPEPVVLLADGTGVELEWRAPALSQHPVTGADGRRYARLETRGWMQTQSAGQPQLPYASALVVVPPTGAVTLDVRVVERDSHALSHPVLPAPRMEAVGDPPVGLGPTWVRDDAAYAPQDPSAPQWVTLEEAGWMRGRRLMRLTFSPLHFDPAQPALEEARLVRLTLTFQDSTTEPTGWADDDPFTPLLERSVVNPAQVSAFARPASAPDPTISPLDAGYPPSDTQYLVIAHASFMDAVAPLVAHRAISDGLTVFTTTVQNIYTTEGEQGAIAIREYISHTYHSSPTPALDYVLLVGDGMEGDPDNSYVPPYILTEDEPDWWSSVTTEPWQPASDNRFVTVDDDNDRLADIAIGRLPVNTVAQAETVVGKILSYELDPPQWPWNERVLFFAGHEKDASETFHYDSDLIYSTLPVTYTGYRTYFCTSDCDPYYKYDDIDTAHDAAVARLNAGGLLAGYVGHSSWHQWDWHPVTFAPMFHMNDVANLNSGGALPVFLQMTCYTGRFAKPDEDTLDETLVRREGGGAVAAWGSTTLGRTSGHRVLYRAFFDSLFVNGTVTLGLTIDEAKLALYNQNHDLDLLDTFVLLGDPALDLNLDIVPWTDYVFLPLVMRGY